MADLNKKSREKRLGVMKQLRGPNFTQFVHRKYILKECAKLILPKGQIISKGLFGILEFSKKPKSRNYLTFSFRFFMQAI